MIRLEFFKQDDFSGLDYALDENQLQYTSSVKQALQRIEERNDSNAFAITVFDDVQACGFFVLDFGEDKFELSDNPKSVLLRSLSVNPIVQGKGIGKAAMKMADDFVKKNFPDCNEIVLAVNQKNNSAYHIYLKAGYVYNGKSRMGRSGPQYLMYKNL